jgi:hypothetical protein
MFQACYIDQIFHLPGGTAPHVLVAVRKLGERTRMKGDRLGEVELDRVAPGQEHLFDNAQYKLMADERGRQRRPDEQPAEALGPLPVKASLAERCLVKVVGQILVEP